MEVAASAAHLVRAAIVRKRASTTFSTRDSGHCPVDLLPSYCPLPFLFNNCFAPRRYIRTLCNWMKAIQFECMLKGNAAQAKYSIVKYFLSSF